MLEFVDHGRVREIRLARPPVNALNPEFVSLLTVAMREGTGQADAIVLSGLPGIFSAGLDVVELLPLGREGMRDFWRDFVALLESIACAPVPVASAITGHSPAGGALINLVTDYRVMRNGKYKIGLNETRVGLVIPPLLQDTMSMVTGPRLAEKLIVPGVMLSADRALEAGLVDALEDSHESVTGHAVDWCQELLALPRQAMLGNRAIARRRYHEAFSKRQDESVDALTDAWFSTETQVEMKALVARLKK